MGPVEPLDDALRYRCGACGNVTRFDVVERTRARRFYHFTLAGDLRIEEEAILDAEVEEVVCRWCNSSRAIEVVPRARQAEASGG